MRNPKPDLVQKLKTWKGRALTHVVLNEAADEIERIRAQRDEARAEVDLKGSRLDDALDEIERLRAENARLLGGECSRSGPADIPALDNVNTQEGRVPWSSI